MTNRVSLSAILLAGKVSAQDTGIAAAGFGDRISEVPPGRAVGGLDVVQGRGRFPAARADRRPADVIRIAQLGTCCSRLKTRIPIRAG